MVNKEPRVFHFSRILNKRLLLVWVCVCVCAAKLKRIWFADLSQPVCCCSHLLFGILPHAARKRMCCHGSENFPTDKTQCERFIMQQQQPQQTNPAICGRVCWFWSGVSGILEEWSRLLGCGNITGKAKQRSGCTAGVLSQSDEAASESRRQHAVMTSGFWCKVG